MVVRIGFLMTAIGKGAFLYLENELFIEYFRDDRCRLEARKSENAEGPIAGEASSCRSSYFQPCTAKNS
jgi:hypothetical protein